MTELLDILKSFNRKERFYLIGQALGNREFQLSSEFRNQVGSEFDLIIPEHSFVAMDYHLDWIYASLKYWKEGKDLYSKDNIITATQEDVDLIICYQQNGMNHLIMIEAKGETSWTNKQLQSKAQRLEKIFGKSGDNWKDVKPYFLIMSPRPSKNLITDTLPSWMLRNGNLIWMQLEIPDDLLKVIRCEGNRRPSINGLFWKIASK